MLRVLFWKADRMWLELHGALPLVGPGAGPWEEDFSMDRQLAFEYFPKDVVELKKIINKRRRMLFFKFQEF